MDKREEIQKEIQVFEVQLRAERLKKLGLEKETRDLFNEKINYMNEIPHLKQQVKEASSNLKSLQEKIIEDKKNELIIKKSLQDSQNALDSKAKSIDIEKESLDAEKKKLDGGFKNLKDQSDRVKEQARKLNRVNEELLEDRQRHENDLAELKGQQAIFEGREKQLKEDKEKVKSIREEFNEDFSKLKEVQYEVEQDKLATKTEIDTLAQYKKIIENEKENLTTAKNEYITKQQELAVKISKAEFDSKSLLKRIGDLDTREKEVRILELRVNKIIREKNLDKELKTLQEG